jgi:hypothetical protein
VGETVLIEGNARPNKPSLPVEVKKALESLDAASTAWFGTESEPSRVMVSV